ncbi:MAG: hypothetical protein OEZ34_08680, partial [Spirochaetia bacterium]|nr:hypothetical protein [Spirochaetia bacterium]
MNFYRSIKRIRESWNDSAAVKITNIRKPEINLNRNKNHSAAALLLPAIAFFFPLFLPSPTDAYIGLCCAKCGGNMPLNLCSAGVPETHEFRITVSPMLMKMSGLQEKEEKINPDSRLSLPSEWYSGLFPGSMSMMMPMSMPMSGMTMAPDNSTVAKDNITGGLTGRKYMAVPVAMRMEMIHVNIGYSFTDHFYGEIMLMAKSSKMKMKYNYMMTQMLGKIYDTMESKGMADTMLMGKYRLYADDSLMPRSQISMIAGVNAPTGSIREKGFSHDMNITQPQALLAHFSDAYREKELLPYSMQLGSGTFDPVAGIEYQGSASPFWWGVNMLYTARVYRNKEGWSPGDELRTDFFLMYQLTYNLVSQ